MGKEKSDYVDILLLLYLGGSFPYGGPATVGKDRTLGEECTLHHPAHKGLNSVQIVHIIWSPSTYCFGLLFRDSISDADEGHLVSFNRRYEK